MVTAAYATYTVTQAGLAQANITGTIPSGTVADDILIALVSSNNNNTGWTTATSGWSRVPGISPVTHGDLYYKIAVGSDTGPTFSVVSGSGALRLQISRWTGVSTTSPFGDAVMTEISATNSAVATGVTATTTQLLVGLITRGGASGSMTSPASMTEAFQDSSAGSTQVGDYEIVSSGATGTRTWTLSSTASPAVAAMLVLNDSAYTGTANLPITATVATAGIGGTNSPAPLALATTISTTGQALGASTRSTTATLSTAGQGSTPAPVTVTAAIVTAGTLTSASSRSTTANLTTAGAGAGSSARAATATLTSMGGGSSGPTRATTATLATSGSAAATVPRVVTAAILTAGVLGGTAISTDKRPLVMDFGTIREAQDTDTVVVPGFTPGGGGSAAPTLIAEDTSYEVAEDTQVPTFARCKVDGTLIVTGTLG